MPGMDYLDFFDDEEHRSPNQNAAGMNSDALALVPVPVTCPVESLGHQDGGLNLVTVEGRARRPKRNRPNQQPLKNVGFNSKGSLLERKAWGLAMTVHRMKKKQMKSEQDFVEVLSRLQKRSKTDPSIRLVRDGQGNVVRKGGLVKQMIVHMKSTGNRHVSKWGVGDFLTCAFGADQKQGKRIKAQTSQALAIGMHRTTVCYMRAVVAGAVLARQSNLLARIYLLCKAQPPICACLREGFDETSQLITVKGEKGAWQVCVVRHTLVIIWPPATGENCPRQLKIPIAARGVYLLRIFGYFI